MRSLRTIAIVLVATTCLGLGLTAASASTKPASSPTLTNVSVHLAGGQTLSVFCATTGENWNLPGTFPLLDHCPRTGPPVTTTTTAPPVTTTTTLGPPAGELTTPASYFGNDVTNQRVTGWAIDPSSGAAVSGAGGLLGSAGISTWINDNRSIFVVPASQPEVLLAEGTPTDGRNWCGSYFTDNAANSSAPPAGNYNSLFYAPVPAGVYYSTASTDDEVAVVQAGALPQEYDFWLFGQGGQPTGSGDKTYPGKIIDPFWSAGSPNPDVSVWDVGNGGQLSTTVNPPDFANGCGDSASGMSVAATTITEQDVYNAVNDPSATGGGIDHALSLEVPWNLCNGDRYPSTNPYPDCSQAGAVLQEGDYFRLSSAANCGALNSDGAPPLAFMVCYALQNYGMVVMDRNTENQGAIILEGEDPADWVSAGHTGTDPFTAAMGSAGQGAALSDIPWSDLQLVDPPAGHPCLARLVTPHAGLAACHPGGLRYR